MGTVHSRAKRRPDGAPGSADRGAGPKRPLYQNASEVLREGLRLVETREVEEAAKLDALLAAATAGVTLDASSG